MSTKPNTKKTLAIVVAVIVILAIVAGAYYYTTSTTPAMQTSTMQSSMVTQMPTQVTSAAATGQIKIGLITPLSGIYAPDGMQVQQGAQVAADELNAAGGIMGQQVQILAQDEGSTTADTVNAAQILVNQQQVNFMIGPYFSGDVKAVLPITTGQKIVQILTVSSLDALMVPPQNQYLFRVTLPDSGYATMALAWLNITHAKSFVYEAEDYGYAHEIGSFLTNQSASAGVTMLSSDYFPDTATDYSSAINKIASLKPDGVVVVMEGTNGIDFQKQYGANPAVNKIPIFHLETLLILPTNAQSINTAVPGGVNDVFVGPISTITSKTAAFMQTFETKYGITASHYAMDGYDGVMILANAVNKAGSTNPDAVANALTSTDYTGPGGHVIFLSNHNPTVGPGYLTGTIYQVVVTNNEIHYNIVWPSSASNSTAVNPATGQPYS
ncbi:MAG TPA: ABC transporter substrate-binding protein [Candidatus Acidoferrales bacterium]|nr:ABC transporter substrate-binding protein [Candidatus Acidoferrales bacterium]